MLLSAASGVRASPLPPSEAETQVSAPELVVLWWEALPPDRPADAPGRRTPRASNCAAPRRTTLRVRRRFASHQLRHAHAVEMAREGVPLIVIQRQLGHTNLGITSIYLQGIDSAEIIDTVHARRPPVVQWAAR